MVLMLGYMMMNKNVIVNRKRAYVVSCYHDSTCVSFAIEIVSYGPVTWRGISLLDLGKALRKV